LALTKQSKKLWLLEKQLRKYLGLVRTTEVIMSRDDAIEMGKAAERLLSHTDFKTIWEAYTIDLVLEATEGFDGGQEQVEVLKSIAKTKQWFLQLIEDAKTLQQGV
jgi:hypothetical protein